MPALKEADLVLVHGDVLTMDDSGRVLSDGAVVVRGREIADIGPSADVLSRWKADTVLDCLGHSVLPGLINTHTHAPMSLLRGMADDLRLDVWLYGYIIPVEKQFVSPEFCRVGATLACAEMIRSGVTCFADMYYFEDVIAQAVAQVGMRAVLGETIMKTPTPDATSYDDSLIYTRDLLSRWRGHELVVPAVAPHSIYQCTEEILHACSLMALQHDALQLIHVAETAQEVQDLGTRLGMSPVHWLLKQGLLVGKLLFAHGVHLTDEEMGLLGERGVGVAHNPTSNLKLASGIARVEAMRQRGIPVGIGTDGCASNNDLDMFEEMRLAALLPKGTSGDPTALPAETALRLATIEGARALHLDHIIGSIEPGKRADLIVLDMRGLHSTPAFFVNDANYFSRIVYGSKASDVRHVLVNGRLLMKDRELLTVDVDHVRRQAEPVGGLVSAFLSAREGNLLDKLVALGEVGQQETFEVHVKAHLDDPQPVLTALFESPLIVQERSSYRKQFDTYFVFEDSRRGHIRYREDDVQLPDGSVTPRYGLTLRGEASEREYEGSIVLTRSRFTARAVHSLRFYREYLQPDRVKEVHKERRRFHIRYRGLEFELNLDRLTKPERPGVYLEIKSRTWSSADAVRKAELIAELQALMHVPPDRIVKGEYLSF